MMFAFGKSEGGEERCISTFSQKSLDNSVKICYNYPTLWECIFPRFCIKREKMHFLIKETGAKKEPQKNNKRQTKGKKK